MWFQCRTIFHNSKRIINACRKIPAQAVDWLDNINKTCCELIMNLLDVFTATCYAPRTSSKPNSIAIPTSSFQQPANVESNNILRPAVPLPAIPIPTIPLPPHIQTTTKIWNPVTGPTLWLSIATINLPADFPPFYLQITIFIYK